MSFDAATLERFRAAEEVEIETVSTSGAARRAVIWIVANDRDAYVRSVRGDRGRWYRDLRERPSGAILVDGERIAVRVAPAGDGASVELVSELLRAKYGRRSRASTASMLLPETLPTTLRLEPV
ncbi:MAG: DUF2255 family protein [Chloroflexi bacterium]|nr:DUF2255 family protein [Chloroflexota bacterium]